SRGGAAGAAGPGRLTSAGCPASGVCNCCGGAGWRGEACAGKRVGGPRLPQRMLHPSLGAQSTLKSQPHHFVTLPIYKEHPMATQLSNAAPTAQPAASASSAVIDPRTVLDHVHLIVRS